MPNTSLTNPVTVFSPSDVTNDHVSIPVVELDQPHMVRGFIVGAVKKNLSL